MTGAVRLYRGNLLDVGASVIVNAANSTLLGGGGVDGAIHRAAGPKLKEACRPLAPCPPGEVRVTPGFDLGDVLIFHTVGPIWSGGGNGEAETLRRCYEICLAEFQACGRPSIVFPAISTGAYGYPIDQAAAIATEACHAHAGAHEGEIILAAFNQANHDALARALALNG